MAPHTTPKTIAEVNFMDYEEFIGVFGNVIEHCSLCAAAVWRYRPFIDIHHLHEEICKFVDALPTAGELKIRQIKQNKTNQCIAACPRQYLGKLHISDWSRKRISIQCEAENVFQYRHTLDKNIYWYPNHCVLHSVSQWRPPDKSQSFCDLLPQRQ